jgi:hypothetical protein
VRAKKKREIRLMRSLI